MDKRLGWPVLSRREALRILGNSFGLVGLAGTLGSPMLHANNPPPGPLAPKSPHFPGRAKHVIFIFLNGGISQVDTFDPKPMLDKYNGKPAPGGNLKTTSQTGNLMRSPFTFKKYGESGIEVSDIFPNIGKCIDEFCVIRSLYSDGPDHTPGLLMMNCGHLQVGRPSMGSWITYGLGSENQNLPGFVVLCPGMPILGPPLWSSAFLPAIYQGTYVANKETDPLKLITDIRNTQLNLAEQRRQLDVISQLNTIHMEARRHEPELEARIQAMEIAYHMQTEAPDVFDIRKETEATRQRYGDSDFAHGCLMALRLVEHGVRVVQIYFGNGQPWDSHQDILDHRQHALTSDRPIAALVQDLKARGLLQETLVIVGSEFGRTPAVQLSTGLSNGRDHNPYGFTMLLAGGGVKGGIVYGATDEFGVKAVENPMHVHDLHATVLYSLGFDHEKLTYRYSGRDFRLTDVSGKVVKEIIV
jgi:hypothetical protein